MKSSKNIFLNILLCMVIMSQLEFEAFIHIDNKASKNLFMKCGFIQVEETKYIKKVESE